MSNKKSIKTIDDEYDHAKYLHRIQLEILGRNQIVSALSNTHYNPCIKLVIVKILQKLSTTYSTEVEYIMVTKQYQNIFDDLNKFGSHELAYYEAFMKFILASNIDTYSAFSKDFLELLTQAF